MIPLVDLKAQYRDKGLSLPMCPELRDGQIHDVVEPIVQAAQAPRAGIAHGRS